MKNIIKCVNEECGHEEPVKGDEWIYKGRELESGATWFFVQFVIARLF